MPLAYKNLGRQSRSLRSTRAVIRVYPRSYPRLVFLREPTGSRIIIPVPHVHQPRSITLVLYQAAKPLGRCTRRLAVVVRQPELPGPAQIGTATAVHGSAAELRARRIRTAVVTATPVGMWKYDLGIPTAVALADHVQRGIDPGAVRVRRVTVVLVITTAVGRCVVQLRGIQVVTAGSP